MSAMWRVADDEDIEQSDGAFCIGELTLPTLNGPSSPSACDGRLNPQGTAAVRISGGAGTSLASRHSKNKQREVANVRFWKPPKTTFLACTEHALRCASVLPT
jgi:hypothetical protein